MPDPSPPTLEELTEDVPPDYRPIFAELTALTDAFCASRLDAEYRDLCRDMAAWVCQEGSPVRSGKVAGWASAVVYGVGRVNFLSDPDQTPHLRADDICKGFGVSEATMHKRWGEVRDALDVMVMDPRWCRRNLIDENPMIWYVETASGMVVDLRLAPREVQVEAFEMGMIPYIPADRAPERDAPPDIVARIGPGVGER